MHDCRTMESRLVDLVLGEVKADEKLRMLAELETCTGCLNDYQSMASSLDFFDQAFETSVPLESFWPEHHAKLGQGLERITPNVIPRRDTFWRRIMVARLPVPVPVAGVITLALLVSSVMALRPSSGEVATVAQPAVVRTATPEVIEVPVVREKVVTRIVYVEKKVGEKNDARPPARVLRSNDRALAVRSAEKESGQGGLFTRTNLTDFQPPDEMRIRIVKRSNQDEN